MTGIEIGFRVRDHPSLGYRKEDRIDLERTASIDIQQGAFMGDAIFVVDGNDFGTRAPNLGWRGLVEWCLRLDVAIGRVASGKADFRMSVPDGNDYVQFRREGDLLVISESQSDAVAHVRADEFVERAKGFIKESVTWIGENYPAAQRNKQAEHFWERLRAYL